MQTPISRVRDVSQTTYYVTIYTGVVLGVSENLKLKLWIYVTDIKGSALPGHLTQLWRRVQCALRPNRPMKR